MDDKINPRLSSTRVAVLPGTITEQFIVEEFPQAKRILFSGPTGQSEAVRALTAGDVDVVASAGILSLGEVQRQNLPASEFSLEPIRPLTCEFYGVALPAGDTQWQTFIDDFIARTHTDRLAEEVPRNLLDNQLDIVDFCLNQVSN